jgi:hypothetical protein
VVEPPVDNQVASDPAGEESHNAQESDTAAEEQKEGPGQPEDDSTAPAGEGGNEDVTKENEVSIRFLPQAISFASQCLHVHCSYTITSVSAT